MIDYNHSEAKYRNRLKTFYQSDTPPGNTVTLT